jgi:hypothetical protein
MISLLMKVALAAALTLASVAGLVGISGLIIFADVGQPEPSAVVQSAPTASATTTLKVMGPNQ